MRIPCIKCKGSSPLQSCGRVICPIIAKSEALFRVKEKAAKENFFGDSPSVFVGHNFYPSLYTGILSPPEQREDAWLYDAPGYWAEKELQIPQIIDYRSALINSRFRMHVRQNTSENNRFLEISREIGMASAPVGIEISLKDKPVFRLSTDPEHAPMGPNAKLEKARITENPKIDWRVDKAVSDTGLKANSALVYLYKKGFDENFLTKLLSIGDLGLKYQRRLVPTRWSISATDDMIARHLLEQVRRYNQTGYSAYFGGYLGNYFLILSFPEVYSYELFEMYMPRASWNTGEEINYTTDYEPYEGRKTYAENCGGGFYACRLAIAEKLKEIKRQGSVLALRFITGEYAVPLGVWVVREAARKAMNNKPLEFSNKELMLKYAGLVARKKFGCNLETLLNQSILLRKVKSQRKLTKFI